MVGAKKKRAQSLKVMNPPRELANTGRAATNQIRKNRSGAEESLLYHYLVRAMENRGWRPT